MPQSQSEELLAKRQRLVNQLAEGTQPIEGGIGALIAQVETLAGISADIGRVDFQLGKPSIAKAMEMERALREIVAPLLSAQGLANTALATIPDIAE